MASWLVTQGDRQFSARDLAELKRLASEGTIGPADMIQPPGAADWLYASELPELKSVLQPAQASEDDFDMPRRGVPTGVIAAILLLIVAVGGYGMWHFASGIKGANLSDLGLELSEMLVTADPAVLHTDPDAGSAKAGTANKDSAVQLVAKRGTWYQVETETGAKGWLAVDSVVPAYFFEDSETREDYDPIYNPDRYVFVKNSSWMQLPDQRSRNVTVFQFLLQNKSKFDMTDLVLLATIKDKGGRVLEEKEIAIEGIIPPYNGVMVGTLQPERRDRDGVSRLMTATMFEDLSKDDPDLNMRWSDGIEVQMASEGFVEANIDLLQVRAVPKKL